MRRMRQRAAAVLAAVAMSLAVAAAVLAAKPPRDDKKPAKEPPAKYAPGTETRVDDPAVGDQGHYLVYVPTEYKPDHAWPVIFCYSAYGPRLSFSPFKEALGGKGFILVAMPFFGSAAAAYRAAENDVANVGRVLEAVTAKVKVDQRQLFIGGSGQGGWMAAAVGEASAAMWAGIAIVGAGRYAYGPAKTVPDLARKPVYVGCGEDDSYHESAQSAAAFYRSQGAAVTFDTYPSPARGAGARPKLLADWLWTNGPLKQAKGVLGEAVAAQAAGQLGAAHAKFSQVALAAGGHDMGAEAANAAKAIGKDAEDQLAAAEAAVAGKRYPEAVNLLSRVASAYEGAAFAERARKGLDALRTDPAIRATLDAARINAEARALEQQAEAYELAKDYASAIRLYTQYVASYEKADRYAAVKARLDALKADKAVLAAVGEQEAQRECRPWLSMADNFLKAGAPENARPYLQKILDKYGDTTWGQQARERMKQLK